MWLQKPPKVMIFVASALFLLAVVAAGCGGGDAVSKNGKGAEAKGYTNLLVEASTIGGIGYSYAAGLSEVAAKVAPEVNLTLEATAGYKENAKRLAQGIGHIGIVGQDDAYDLYKKTGEYSNVQETFLAMFPAHTLDWHIIVRADSDIHSIWDLKGKRVNKQPKGGSAEALSTAILEALGIEHQPLYMPHTDAAEAMMSRSIDAHIVAGAPTQFRELSTRLPLRVIDLTQSDIDQILTHLPYLTSTTFPAGTYYKGASDVHTVSLWAVFVARKDLPEDLIYRLVKGVYENKDIMEAAHASAKDLDPKHALQLSIPLHPGALKYFEEAGVEIPDHLRP